MNEDIIRKGMYGVRLSIKNVITQNLKDRNAHLEDGVQHYNFSMDGATVSNDRNISQVVAVLEHLDLNVRCWLFIDCSIIYNII
jgi:hypothetical protein